MRWHVTYLICNVMRDVATVMVTKWSNFALPLFTLVSLSAVTVPSSLSIGWQKNYLEAGFEP